MDKSLVPVAAKTYALMGHICELIDAIKEALDDGWQPGTDIPDIIRSGIQQIVPIVRDGAAVVQEWDEDPIPVMQAGAYGAVDLIAALITKG